MVIRIRMKCNGFNFEKKNSPDVVCSICGVVLAVLVEEPTAEDGAEAVREDRREVASDGAALYLCRVGAAHTD